MGEGITYLTSCYVFGSIYVICLGAIIGSFLSVCIYRLPIGREQLYLDQDEEEIYKPEYDTKGEKISLLKPARSICPRCKETLRWYHNIPILSWFLLKGKCAFCEEKISFRYPFVEILTALFSFLSWYQFGFSYTALIVFIFCCSLIVISFIDYDYYIIPNVISIPGVFIGLGIGVLNQFYSIFTYPVSVDFVASIIGLLAGGGFLLFISEVYLKLRKKDGLGMGDVKLLAMTGAFFGIEGAFYTLFIGSLVGSILGTLILLLMRKGFNHQLPFGPYLALGTVLYLFAGNSIMLLISKMSLLFVNLFI